MSQLQRIAISPTQLQENRILLTKQQYHYLARVLRLSDGDKFIAIDGMGKWWLVKLHSEYGEILEVLDVHTELRASIKLLLALPKGNAFDDIVRVCTELGVDQIAPIISERTLLNPSSQKLDRWRRIAVEAAEQSERAFVPTIHEPVNFNQGLSLFEAKQKYICEGRGNNPHLLECWRQQVKTKSQITVIVAVGPEGGWSQRELEIAANVGFKTVSLGKRILRAVTAPIVALSILAAELEYS
ncbi:MAG: 16S rRNA (uracil(1498)-N(3))-methyltransferase [Calothrix sp. C42_A2020_038]|nr:16S rRNA (uracil(1498)-N(3))-methyltransferase [Calothrix sp. C42_A2020_038]